MALPFQRFQHGPFRRMLYRGAIGVEWPQEACYYAHQMMPVDGAYVRRQSEDYAAITVTGNIAQLLYHYDRLQGPLAVGIFSGELYTYASGIWTKRVTTGNLATATVTLSTTAKCFAATFTDKMVISDGVNQPFTWDGSAGAGGLAKLTNAPARCYGSPTVYYGKLFFVKDVAANGADRDTMVWSEENQPNLGYEASPYTNAWRLSQSGAGPLVRLVGTNSGLYYFRPRSIGAVRGAVNSTFVAGGTHDDVSLLVGTPATAAVTLYGDTLYFSDELGRPYRLPIGGTPEPLWEQMATFFHLLTNAPAAGILDPAQSATAPMEYYQAIVFGMTFTGAPGINDMFLFSHATGELLSHWQGPNPVGIMGSVYDSATNRKVFMYSYDNGVNLITAATPPSQQTPYGEAGSNIAAQLFTGPIGGGGEQLWAFDGAEIELVTGEAVGATPPTAVQASFNTDTGLAGQFAGQLGTHAATATIATVTANTNYVKRQRYQAGLRRELRWLQAMILPVAGLKGWGIHAIRASAFALPTYPTKT